MNKTKRLTDRLGFVLGTAVVGAVVGCVGYVDQPRPPGAYYQERQPPPQEVDVLPPPVQVEASVGSVGVLIRTQEDFYEPLTPYGRWEVVGSYGRCWIPGRVEADWRPYNNGYWQRTDAGWYWVSDEPWAWATYHYGRWDFTDQYGWYWVPQTQWAPAWVSWHGGGGYIGWAPLYPSARFARGGSLDVDVRVISPRAFVFVEERHFLEPVRPATVVVNNTTIINQTVNITNIKVVNNTVINEGPETQVIEQVSGRKVQEVPFRELRRKQEAPVIARQLSTAPTLDKKEKNAPTPVRSEVEPRAIKSVAGPGPSQVEKPGVTPRGPAPLTPTGRVTGSENPKPIPSQAALKPATPQPAAIKQATPPKAAKYAQPPEPPAGKSETNAPNNPVPSVRVKPVVSEKNGKAAGKQGHNPKAPEYQPLPEKPAVLPPSSP